VLALNEPMLELALQCIPVEHLRLYFARMLEELSDNISGGRVQDNQRRWLQFCARHRLPVERCHVSWA